MAYSQTCVYVLIWVSANKPDQRWVLLETFLIMTILIQTSSVTSFWYREGREIRIDSHACLKYLRHFCGTQLLQPKSTKQNKNGNYTTRPWVLVAPTDHNGHDLSKQTRGGASLTIGVRSCTSPQIARFHCFTNFAHQWTIHNSRLITLTCAPNLFVCLVYFVLHVCPVGKCMLT